MSLSTFVIDYGVLWTARRQAQNVADAAALAGAIALAYEAPKDWTASGMAMTAAMATAQRNTIWGDPPGPGVAAPDITFPASPSTCIIADCATCAPREFFCVRAD